MSFCSLKNNEKNNDNHSMKNISLDIDRTNINNGRKRKQIEDRKEVKFDLNKPSIHFIESIEASDTIPLSPSIFRLPSMMKNNRAIYDIDACNKRTRMSEDFENMDIASSPISKTKFEKLTKDQIDGKFIKSEVQKQELHQQQ